MSNAKEDLLKKTVAEIEIHIIESALRRARGNTREAAKQLGTTLRILMYRIHKYGINTDEFRLTENAERGKGKGDFK